MNVTWTEEQKKVIELHNRNLLVSAAAGSGKTAVLVERIIRMADRIMVVRDGRVEEIGSRDEILPKLFLEETSCTCMDRMEGR